MKEEFKVLTDQQHVLLRPQMYIGSVTAEDQTGLISGKVQTKHVVPSLIKLVEEIYQNSIDEFIRTQGKFASKIEVTIENNPLLGSSVTVEDNGRGIPVKKIGDSYQPVLAWTTLRAGSNFSDSGRVTAGTNGVGASLVNIFSTNFAAISDDGKSRLLLHCTNNMSTQSVKVLKSVKQGCKITFTPDLARFGLTEITPDHLDAIKDRLENLAVSYEGITFFLNGEKIAYKNLKTVAKSYGESAVILEGLRTKMIIAPSGTAAEFACVSYVNGIFVRNGGSHIDLALGKLIDPLRESIKKKHKIDVMPNAIKQHLLIASWINGYENLKFDSQTKERVTNAASDSNAVYDDLQFARAAKQILNTPEIIDPIVEAILHKKELEDARELRNKQKELDGRSFRKITKFTDATNKDRENSILMIVEGDSANNSVLSARRKFMGSFPLRGKILNTYDMKAIEVLQNKELSNLITVLGLQIGVPVTSKECVRFGKICILADQDFDGEHISGLLLSFFTQYWPNLINLGCLYRFRTPLVLAESKKEKKYFYDLDEFHAWKRPSGTWKTRYLKGLGSSTAKEFEGYFSDDGLKQNMLKIIPSDIGVQKLKMAFSKESGAADARKEWLNLT